MPKTGCFCVLLLTAVFICNNSNCQPANGDSVFYTTITGNVKTAYFSVVKEKTGLYNGVAYEAYGHGEQGTPFFMEDSIVRGPVLYDGFLYEDVPLKYDMVNDELVTLYYYNNVLLQLIKDKVNYFEIMGHQFVRLDKNIQNPAGPSGFCELLYNDKKMQVLAKRTKELKMSTNIEDKSSGFVQYNGYFIIKDDKYVAINAESDLMKLFSDKAQEVKKFMRTAKIKYKKHPEQYMVAATTFYNGLTK